MGKALLFVFVAVIALILVGSLVVSVVGTLFKFAFYLLVGVMVVGGAMYMFGKLRRGIGGSGRREIR